jgi:hypothetical protein
MMFTRNELRDAAAEKSFERGVAYVDAVGRVEESLDWLSAACAR